jgi:hypothetical protein
MLVYLRYAGGRALTASDTGETVMSPVAADV